MISLNSDDELHRAEAYRVDLLVCRLHDSCGEPHGVAAFTTDMYEDLLIRLRKEVVRRLYKC